MEEVLKENQINIFPGYETKDSDQIWLKLISVFDEARESSNFFLLSQSLQKIRTLTFSHFFSITKERIAAIIEPLFEFITTYPFYSFKLQKDASIVFCKICSNPSRLPDIHLSLEKTLSLYDHLFNIKSREFQSGPVEVQFFYSFFNSVSYFFDEKDSDKLLDLYYDQIGYDDPNSLLALTIICRFLPPKQFHKVADDFFNLIDKSICSKIDEVIFFYFTRAAFFNPDFDWSPHYDRIFHSILCAMDTSIEIVGVLAGMGSKTDSYLSLGFDDNLSMTLNAAFVVAILLPGRYAVLNKLNVLVNLMLPTLTPNSKKGATFSSFLNNLINFFHRRIRDVDFHDQEFLDNFVSIVAPYLKTALFTANVSISSIMRKSVQKLCDMSFRVMKDEILPTAVEKMVDEEASNLSTRCFKILTKMTPILLAKENRKDVIGLIPTIVENAYHSMRNFGNSNSASGMNLLCALGTFMYFPQNTDYMDHKEQNAVYSMTSRIVDFVTLFMKGGNSETDKPIIIYEKMDFFYKIVAFFSSFEDSVISEAFPRIFEALIPDFQPHSVCNIMRCLVIAKGDIVIDFFLPKFLNIMKNVVPSYLKFYTNAICGVTYTSPAILNYMDDLCDLAFGLMKSLDAKKMKNVSFLFLDIIQSLVTVINTDWHCAELKDDAREMWGKLYNKNEIKPKWFRFDDEVINKYAHKFFDFVVPFLKENYPKIETKVQERLLTCYGYLTLFLTNRGSFDNIEPLPLNPELKELNEILYDTLKFLLGQNLCLNGLNPIFNFLRSVEESTSNLIFNDFFNCASMLGTKMKCPKLYSRFITLAHRQSIFNAIKQTHIPELTPSIIELIDAVFPFIASPYRNISTSASFFIFCYEFIYPKIRDEMLPNIMEILEKGEYNEDQFRGYLQFVKTCLIIGVLYNPSLLQRYLRLIIQVKFDKKWNVSSLLGMVANELERMSLVCLKIEDNDGWIQFLADLPSLNRAIDIQHFYHIVHFCFSQTPSISVELFRYLLQNVLTETQINKYSLLMTISGIFTKIKPIAPKTKTEERPEFVDNNSVGFFCKPKSYVLYDEPSKFVDENNPLLLCFFDIVDEDYIDKLIPCCVTMHPEKDDPPFLPIIVYIWKGLAQLLKYKVVDFVGSKLIDLLNLSPIHFITACEIFSGIATGIKHWTKEETTNCEINFLKPFLLQLFKHKFTDSTAHIFEFISSNRDPKRLTWLIELLKSLLKETDGIELNQVINCCCCTFSNFGLEFDSEMTQIMTEIVFPKFSSFANVILVNIVEFGYLVCCRENLAVTPNPNYKCDYFNSFFKEIIDREINKNLDKTMKLLCTILIPWKPGNFIIFDQISDRLFALFDHYSKVSSKFDKEAKYVLLIAAEFQWHLYPDKLHEFVTRLIAALPQQKWRTKEAAIGFLHLAIFLHIYQFPTETIQFFFNDVLPFFLFDDNDDIVKNALYLLSLLVNMLYVDNLDKFAQLILSEYHDDSDRMKKLAFLHSCSLLANLTVWEKCPSWLPDIFMEFENLNIKDNSLSTRFQNAMQDFWRRHYFIQIPEIEEYRDVVRRDYFA